MLITEFQAKVESLILETCHDLFDKLGLDDEIDLPEGFALELSGSLLRKLIDDGLLNEL